MEFLNYEEIIMEPIIYILIILWFMGISNNGRNGSLMKFLNAINRFARY